MRRLELMMPYWGGLDHSHGRIQKDLLAGLAVALVLIPQSMAYAQLAGLPPLQGLYAALIPVFVAALWGSSAQLSTGPVAMVSLLCAATLAPLGLAADQYLIAAAVLALLVGGLQLALGFIGIGRILDLLSHSVILGFTNAAAMIIAFSQLDKLLGIERAAEGWFLIETLHLFTQLSDVHAWTLLMGTLALLALWALRRLCPRVPAVPLVAGLAILVSWQLGFADHGGRVVGQIPSQLPSLQWPSASGLPWGALLSGALVIALVGFLEALTVARAVAHKTGHRLDTDRELIGQGLANVAAGLSQAYPVSGSFSRTAVNLSAGAQTALSSLATSALVALALLLLMPLLGPLPQAVLAAVIISAVLSLFHPRAMLLSWRTHRREGLVVWVTFVATLVFAPHLDYGLLCGVLLAVAANPEGLRRLRRMHRMRRMRASRRSA